MIQGSDSAGFALKRVQHSWRAQWFQLKTSVPHRGQACCRLHEDNTHCAGSEFRHNPVSSRRRRWIALLCAGLGLEGKDEPIAALGESLDVARLFSRIVQGRPTCKDAAPVVSDLSPTVKVVRAPQGL